MRRLGLCALAYLLPTFALGFVWHLILFKDYYDALQMYRQHMIIPFGFLAMTLQSFLFAWVFDGLFAQRLDDAVKRAVAFSVFGAVLSWSYTTLSVAAKNVMTSVPDYLVIETAFTLAQWAMVGPLTVLTHRKLTAKSQK